MKMKLTALTRPRSSSGVDELDGGAAHHHAHLVGDADQDVAATESGNQRDRPKTMVATP